MTISRRHTHENADAAGFQNSRKVYFEAHEDSIYIKQVLKMAMQQIYLPMLYKRYAGKPVEKGLVIFADAHHEDLPFP